MDKNKKSISKKTLTSIIISIASLLVIGGYYLYASADDDAFKNKLTIANSSITAIVDGEEPFDTDDSSGNDSSSNNKKVRTFDTVNYSVSFDLIQKLTPTPDTSDDTDTPQNGDDQNANNDNGEGESQVGEVTPDNRKIIVGVIFPSTLNGEVYANGQHYLLTPVFDGKKYAEFEIESSIGTSNFDFSVEDIYGENESSFEPIIVLKESTDEAVKSISGLTEEQKTQSFDTVKSLLGNNSSCTIENGCNVTISGKEQYFVKLFKGSHKVDGKDTEMAVGFMVGLNSTEEKGIKGTLYPASVNFDIDISKNNANSIIYDSESTRTAIKPYNQSNPDYDIYIDENHSQEMPDTYNGNVANGEVSATYDNNKLSVSVSNMDFIPTQMTQIDGNNVYYLSTNSFIIKSSRINYENKDDIEITFNAKKGDTILSTISDTDKLGRFVGPFESRIRLYDENNNPNTASNVDKNKEDGLAILNYGEMFYLMEDVQYATTFGDELNDLTNYIKVDNDAIELIADGQTERVIKAYSSAANVTNAASVYYYGKWTSDYIKRKSDAPSSCPDISTLSKEGLMNLYGGPCIEFKENVVKSEEHFDTSIGYGPMLVETKFTSTDGNGILPNSVWSIIYKANVIDNSELEKSVHQISNSSIATFKNNDGNNELYYLSNQTDYSDVNSMMNSNNYTKTEYDFVNRNVTTNHSTICSGATYLNCSITGNSILVSALRVTKPTIETYLTNMPSRETTDFYYYPIQWKIKGSAYKSTTNPNVRFNNAYVKVFFPSYLQKIDYGEEINNNITNEEVTTENIDGEEYKVYSFTVDMKNKSVVDLDLPIYTNIYLNTPNNSRPKVYAEIDYDVTNGNGISSSISPLESRKVLNDRVTIHNLADINTQGTTTPAYIEKNGAFNYKMQAYNNSSANYTYSNASLFYVLPYKGDSSYSDLSSKFVSTGYKVKITNLPSGYKAYYTTGPSNTIISEEIYINSTMTHEWTEWSNPTEEKQNITAIRISKTGDFSPRQFFGGEDGINVEVTPIGSGVGDIYYNAFYIITDRPSNYSCVPQSDDDPTCDSIRNSRVFYNSNRSSVSVYNRQISGFVWEDYDYSGVFDNDETKMQDIPVSVCKVSDEKKTSESYNKLDPNTYVTDTDECLKETVTDATGSFMVNGLTEGDYYVKYTFDNQKYTVTDFGRSAMDLPSDSVNSKAFQLPGKNIAVSYVISFTNDNKIMKREYLNLGLKIKKQFAVDINKYITKTELTINGDTTTKTYDNSTKVSLSVRKTDNAHVRVTYGFVIENIKYFPGYVGLISDFMPSGMTFNPNLKENQDWIQVGNLLYYNGLSNRLLIPGEKNYFSLVLDLDIKKGGNYINFVSTSDLILMGDDVPIYDFINNSSSSGSSSSGGDTNNSGTQNNGEGN